MRTIKKRIKEYLSYRRTVKELSQLTDRELSDINISRSDIVRIAKGLD